MRNLFITACLFIHCLAATAQMGNVQEGKTVKSTLLGKNVRYSVYLPPNFGTSERKYPVVYLLHGYGDDETGWVQFGEVNRLADKAIADGTIPPMIIVMPDGQKDWYVNSVDGKVKWEDFFIQEFLPAIEKTYPIRAEKRYRGIAGLSMGGYGSLVMATKHPDLFAACAPLSAAVWTDEEIKNFPEANYTGFFKNLFGVGSNGNRISEHWKANSILTIMETGDQEKLKSVRYWIDCGDDDFLIGGNCALHLLMKDKKIPHKFMVRHGEHNWPYWRSGIIPALQFIGESFHQF
ncbi:MAG: esterase family protein [Cytophagaceae bacterium]|nr:esterase family protein [Cytophagaceae bacterium]